VRQGWKLGWSLVVLSAAALLVPARSEAQECRTTCGPNTNCSTSCYVNAAQVVWTTCGAGGFQCRTPPPPPPCNPSWEQIGSQPAGFVNYNDYPINQCNTFGATKITERDRNGCRPNRTYCTYRWVGWLHGCCLEGCYPQTFDYTSCR
jgi:hypothetical protein